MKDNEERTELQRQRTTNGKRLLRPQPEHLSVFQLAELSGISYQRIYEKIKAKELLAVKIGSSLRIEKTAAHEFLLQSNRKEEIQRLRGHLLELGKTKAAVRKRIYRLRKAGVIDSKIAETLKEIISQL